MKETERCQCYFRYSGHRRHVSGFHISLETKDEKREVFIGFDSMKVAGSLDNISYSSWEPRLNYSKIKSKWIERSRRIVKHTSS